MSIKPAQGGFRGYHNYFTPEEYIRRNHEDGVVHTRDGQRAAPVSADFMTGLFDGLELEVGLATEAILTRAGREWGKRDLPRFARRMQKEYGGGTVTVHEMNLRFVLQSWWWPLRATGWGSWELDVRPAPGLTRIRVKNAATAAPHEHKGAPVCHLYAGLFAECFEYLEEEPRDAIEIDCHHGAHPCVFLVGSPDAIERIRTQRAEGQTATAILAGLP